MTKIFIIAMSATVLLMRSLTFADTSAPPATAPATFEQLNADQVLPRDPAGPQMRFRWNRAPGAVTTYVLNVSKSKTFQSIDFTVRITVSGDNFTVPPGQGKAELGNIGGGFFSVDYTSAPNAFKVGQLFNWKVAALDKEGRVIANSEVSNPDHHAANSSSFTIQNGTFAGLSFQRSSSGKDVKEAPVFAFGKPEQHSSSPTYSADIAVVEKFGQFFGPNRGKDYYRDIFGLTFSAEAHVSSDPAPTASQHNIAVQTGFTWLRDWSDVTKVLEDDTAWGKNAFETYTTGTIKYESSQDARKQDILFSVRMMPMFYPIGAEYEKILVPSDKPEDARNLDESKLSFNHEENFGFDVGGVTRGTSNALENQTTIFRLVAEAHPQLNIRYLRIQGILDYVSIYADDTFRFLVPESRGVNFLSAGVDFHLNETTAVSFYYKVGRDAPSFQNKVESINFGFSVTP